MVRFSSLIGATLAVVIVVVTPASGSFPAPNYDPIGHETFNDVDESGQEIPYTSSVPRQFNVDFDTSAYTIEQGESIADIGSSNRCEGHYSGRSGWVRFNPGVAGKIQVRAHTPTYDSIVYIARSNADLGPTWKTDTIADVGPANCSDATIGGGDEFATFDALANHIYYIHVGGLCPGDYTTCADPGVPGGDTSLRLTFIPGDQDQDGVPDSKERQVPDCTNAGTRGSVTTDGCPDIDHDNIADYTEGSNCVGEQGVADADKRYNGCAPGTDAAQP